MRHPARVGLLHFGGPGTVLEVLRSGLRQLGYGEGKNIVLEPRYAEGQLDRFTDFAADLCRLEVDVIVALGAVAARAAQKATTTIAIIFAVVIDPVAAGFATTLERPGGNLTGITSFDPQQPRLQCELLKQVIPTLSRVALLSDGDIPRAADGGLNPQSAAEFEGKEVP